MRIEAAKTGGEAALICLGDQPQVEERSVRTICNAFLSNKSQIVVPSYEMQRGHPWLIARPLWDELFEMKAPKTPLDFLKKDARNIHYVIVDTPSILTDIDTPEDYENVVIIASYAQADDASCRGWQARRVFVDAANGPATSRRVQERWSHVGQ